MGFRAGTIGPPSGTKYHPDFREGDPEGFHFDLAAARANQEQFQSELLRANPHLRAERTDGELAALVDAAVEEQRAEALTDFLREREGGEMSNDRVGLAEKLPGEAWRWLAGNNDEVVVRLAEMPRALDRVSHVRAFLAEVSDACDDRARDDRTVQSSLEAKFFHDILLHFVTEWGKVRQKFIDPNPAG